MALAGVAQRPSLLFGDAEGAFHVKSKGPRMVERYLLLSEKNAASSIPSIHSSVLRFHLSLPSVHVKQALKTPAKLSSIHNEVQQQQAPGPGSRRHATCKRTLHLLATRRRRQTGRRRLAVHPRAHAHLHADPCTRRSSRTTSATTRARRPAPTPKSTPSKRATKSRSSRPTAARACSTRARRRCTRRSRRPRTSRRTTAAARGSRSSRGLLQNDAWCMYREDRIAFAVPAVPRARRVRLRVSAGRARGRRWLARPVPYGCDSGRLLAGRCCCQLQRRGKQNYLPGHPWTRARVQRPDAQKHY